MCVDDADHFNKQTLILLLVAVEGTCIEYLNMYQPVLIYAKEIPGHIFMKQLFLLNKIKITENTKQTQITCCSVFEGTSRPRN